MGRYPGPKKKNEIFFVLMKIEHETSVLACLPMSVCVCVCVCERERERER